MFLSLTLTMDLHQGPVISSASIKNTLITIYIHKVSGFIFYLTISFNNFRKSGVMTCTM